MSLGLEEGYRESVGSADNVGPDDGNRDGNIDGIELGCIVA